jgi:hypothetical protein
MVVRLRAGPLRTLFRSPGGYIFIFYKRHNEALGPIQPSIQLIKGDLSLTRGEGQAVARLVEALHYKPEGRGFDF